jgi:virulence factor Mce-like protein
VKRRVLGVVVVVAVLLGGVALVKARGGHGGYHLTARFAQAVGLYPHGDVTVMGIDVGTVDAVELEDTFVRVEMTINDDVPLPEDVQATIEPLQLIGERNVVLFPAWTQAMADEGKQQAEDGATIGLDRTHTPVEPDEGLQAFNDLAQSLDPDTVGQLIGDSADVLNGRGADLGAAIDQAASLTDVFARTDDDLVGAAEALHRLAAAVNTRDDQLASVVQRFSEASGVLASERDDISRFLSALVQLTQQGSSLLDAYGGTLPTDVANVTALASIFHQNQGAIEALIETLPAITDGINQAYDPTIDGLRLRASATPTVVALIDAFSDILGVLPVIGDLTRGLGGGG